MPPSFLPVGRSFSALTNLVSRDLGNEEDVRARSLLGHKGFGSGQAGQAGQRGS